MAKTSKTSLHLLDDWIEELEAVVATTFSPPPIAAAPAPAAAPTVNKKQKISSSEKEVVDAPLSINSIDLRVGIIKKVTRHETADKLYCEEIDVGEDEPRPIASGLVPHYTLDQMQNRKLIVVCNLQPRKLVGFKSHGMVLCAVKMDEESGEEKVELLDPPADSKPGDRIVGKDLAGEPLSVKQCDKRKAFENVAPGLSVDSEGVACWNGIPLVTQMGGLCKAPTIREGSLR